MIRSTKPKMVEREKKIFCGDTWLDVDIYPAFHVASGRGRKPRQNLTKPAQQNFNTRAARKYFIRLCLANFGKGDYRLDLTYAPGFLPKSYEELQRMGRNFLRRLAALRKRKGLPSLKYVLVKAHGEDKYGRMVRPHHHLIVNGGLTAEEVIGLWRQSAARGGRAYGYVSYVPLQPDEDTGIVGLAAYLASQPSSKKRWSSSQNLQKPEFVTNDSRYRKREAEKLVFSEPYRVYGFECRKLLHYEDWCKRYPGYELVEYDPVYMDDIGTWHVSLRLRRRTGKEAKLCRKE